MRRFSHTGIRGQGPGTRDQGLGGDLPPSAFRLPPSVSPSAFTLVELLVVITIISTLIGLLLPAVQAAREAARRNQCLNNEKQFALAMMNLESNRKAFPGYINEIGNNPNPVSWFVTLFPYLERNDLYDLWANGIVHAGIPVYPEGGLPAGSTGYKLIKLAICPSDPSSSASAGDTSLSYVCNRGVNGLNNPAQGVCLDRFYNTTKVGVDYVSSHDGTSTTLLLAESVLTPPGTNITTKPNNPPYLILRSLLSPGTAYYSRPTSLWTSSDWDGSSGDENASELDLGFEWGTSPTTQLVFSQKIMSRHSGTINVSFCDGHQASLSNNIDPLVYKHLMTPWGSGCQDVDDSTTVAIAPRGVLDEADF